MKKTHITHLLKMLIVLALALHAIHSTAQTVATSWAGGNGSAIDPYQISDISHLRKLAVDCNNGMSFKGKYFCLTNDIRDNARVIDENGNLVPNDNTLRVWTPIGIKQSPFQGVIDGNGHSICGIYGGKEWHEIYGYIPPYSNYNLFMSIFAYAENATFKNLIIQDSFLTSFCRNPINSQITNCINRATSIYTFSNCGIYDPSGLVIKNCGNYGVAYGAGIANGDLYYRLTLINCYNFGEIRLIWDRGGGLCDRAKEILNCMNFGTVYNTRAIFESGQIGYVAGIVRYMPSNTTLSNCVNYGVIEPFGNEYNGAIIGVAGDGYKKLAYISNIYWLETTSPKYYPLKNQYGFVSLTGDALKMTEDEMKAEDFLATLNNNAHKLGDECCGWKMGRNGFPILEIIDEEGAGVENPIVDDNIDDCHPAIYYNLQGCRVANPKNGIFIKVQGTTATKVAL